MLPGELPHQPVGEIVEIVQPFPQIGVGLAQHAGTRVGLHALDRGLRRQSGHHRFAQFVQPAAIVGEHAEGLEHLLVLAVIGDVAALQQQIEIGSQRIDRRFEPLQLLLHVVRDEIGDHDARLVQHHVSQSDAVGDRLAAEMQRAARRGLRAGPGERGELAGGDHLGEHHRGGLQRLLFLLGIGPVRPVLHDQHAQRVAGAQDRHAEERVVDFFAGFRSVREGGVGLGIR